MYSNYFQTLETELHSVFFISNKNFGEGFKLLNFGHC